jgi:hypothetical protein
MVPVPNVKKIGTILDNTGDNEILHCRNRSRIQPASAVCFLPFYTAGKEEDIQITPFFRFLPGSGKGNLTKIILMPTEKLQIPLLYVSEEREHFLILDVSLNICYYLREWYGG